jgi:hypothetical protein
MAYCGLRETETQRGARDTSFSNERLEHHQQIEIKTPRAHIGSPLSASTRVRKQNGMPSTGAPVTLFFAPRQVKAMSNNSPKRTGHRRSNSKT